MDTPTSAPTATERLAQTADRIHPCPPPDVYDGYDLCECNYGGAYPCPRTEAAFIARGLDPATEARRILRELMPADLMCGEAGR